MTQKQLKSKEKLQLKLAGRETSPRKRENSSSDLKTLNSNIEDHVKHFVLCLRDAYGFKDPMEVVGRVTARLSMNFRNVPIEKIFKWYYGNSLGWSTNVLSDICSNKDVDALGINSKDCYDACKIFGGRLMKFLQSFFRRQQRHTQSDSWGRRKAAFSKAQTFLMFKKGSPKVQEALITEADLKHKDAMSNKYKGRSLRRQRKESRFVRDLSINELKNLRQKSPHQEIGTIILNNQDIPETWGDYECDINDPAELQSKIENTASLIISKIFKPGSFRRVMKKEEPLFPSTSAHSEQEAQRAGGGAVTILKEYFDPTITSELLSMDYHPRTGVRSFYNVEYKDTASRLASNLLEDSFLAMPVYLREPLKVRTITKGPSEPYWFFRPIQKFLWNSLQKHPVFELIGTPISSDILDKMLPFSNPLGKWLSGDYSAATDNLVRWLSKHIWSEICIRSGIPDEVYELGLKGLINHRIKYKDGTKINQQNGQLMGSPLSFPILCIANAAICYLAFEKRQPFNKVALRVNGDDCVMRYTENERKKWSEYAEFIGMSPSPGKCYFATDWLQMNSELFIERNGSFRHIPFINFSLASPVLSKGGAKRRVESLSQTMQEFCIGKSPKFIDIWIRRMAPFLKQEVPGLISWYLPQSLGGLGLMSKEMTGNLFTTKQIAVASLFYEKALKGQKCPYALETLSGGKANYQNLCVEKYTKRFPILDKEVPLKKTFWADRFFKEKTKEEEMTPLLWENLVKCDSVYVNSAYRKNILNYKVRRVFEKDSKRIKPIKLSELLRLRGVELVLPSNIYKSSFAPKGIFQEVLAKMVKKSRSEVDLSMRFIGKPSLRFKASSYQEILK